MAAPIDLGLYYIYLILFGGFGGLIYYFYELRNMFPVRELKKPGPPVGFFVNKAGEIKLVRVKDHKGRTFNCKFGSFQLNDDYRYQCGKRDVYFYFIENANPISVEALSLVRDYLVEERQPYLSIKDVRTADNNDKLATKLGSKGLLFLDAYYKIDQFAKADVIYDASTKKNFRLGQSMGMLAYIPQKALFWRTVAVVSINNSKLDVVKAELRQEANGENPRTFIDTEEYGSFEVRDARNRLRRGKTNVFVVAVRSISA